MLFFLNPDNHHGRHIGVATSANQGTEVQVKIRAELQSPVGVRQGHGAFDVVGHCFASGVGNVVNGQDDDVVANTDATVFAPISKEGGVLVNHVDNSLFVSDSVGLPALGLDVVYVQMLASLDGSDDAPNINAVLDHGVIAAEIA